MPAITPIATPALVPAESPVLGFGLVLGIAETPSVIAVEVEEAAVVSEACISVLKDPDADPFALNVALKLRPVPDDCRELNTEMTEVETPVASETPIPAVPLGTGVSTGEEVLEVVGPALSELGSAALISKDGEKFTLLGRHRS